MLNHVSRADRGRSRYVLGLAALAALVVLPLLASPIVVSTDGPSHVYNAFVHSSLRHNGESPFAQAFAVESDAPAGGIFEPLAALLGPTLGWVAAERLLAALTALLLFLSLAWLLRSGGLAVLPLAGWFALSWFLAMGFYDFAISLVFFVLLLGALRRQPGSATMALANLLVLAMWMAHPCTLCVSVAVFVAWLLLLRIHGRVGTSSLLWLAPSLLLVFDTLVLSGVGGSSFSWIPAARQLAGVVVSDHLVSISRIDVIAGITVSALLVYGTWLGARLGKLHGPAGWLAVAGIALISFSVVVPDAVGNGSYIGTRLRMLGTLCILPVAATSLAQSRERFLMASALVLGVSLAVHGVVTLNAATRTRRELDAVLSDLRALGARPRDHIDAHLEDWEYGEFRVSGYLHLADRAARRMRLISLRNYEADLSVFPVRWRTRPLRPTYSADGPVLHVDVAASDDPPPRVFVVHNCSDTLASKYPVRRRCTDRIGVSVIEPTPGR